MIGLLTVVQHSQVTIPVASMTAHRVVNLHDVVDNAGDAPDIREYITQPGRMPIVAAAPDHRNASRKCGPKWRRAGPVTTAQLTQRSLASFAEHSGPSHPLECGSVLHEVCHSCPEFCGTGHWLSFGWDEADISTEIDGEGSEVGDMVGRGPASDHAVVVQAQIEHEDFVSGHDLVGGPVGGFPAGFGLRPPVPLARCVAWRSGNWHTGRS